MEQAAVRHFDEDKNELREETARIRALTPCSGADAFVSAEELYQSAERLTFRRIGWAIEAPRPHGREAKAVDTAARRLRAPLIGHD
jgi:hypothetical protein